jgi:hypothetical protein
VLQIEERLPGRKPSKPRLAEAVTPLAIAMIEVFIRRYLLAGVV